MLRDHNHWHINRDVLSLKQLRARSDKDMLVMTARHKTLFIEVTVVTVHLPGAPQDDDLREDDVRVLIDKVRGMKMREVDQGSRWGKYG